MLKLSFISIALPEMRIIEILCVLCVFVVFLPLKTKNPRKVFTLRGSNCVTRPFRSELQAYCQLDHTRVVGLGDEAKGCRIGEVSVRVREVGLVEQIESLCT
jgi:hypothetical protein